MSGLSIPPNKFVMLGVLGVGAYVLARHAQGNAAARPTGFVRPGTTATPGGQGGALSSLLSLLPGRAGGLVPSDITSGRASDPTYASATDPANLPDNRDISAPFEDGFNYNPDGNTILDTDPGPDWGLDW
jgi:hypothetical protein